MRKFITVSMITCVISINTPVFAQDTSESKIPLPAPNGIPLPKGYQNWQILASSYRKDNDTLRIILGNDVAIKAVRNGMTAWPNQAILAKLVWKARQDENWQTAIVPGQFVHAEFMFKDAQKYASTQSWGWARWLGTEQTPYGADEKFAQECVDCHTAVKSRDYVFTTPATLPQLIE